MVSDWAVRQMQVSLTHSPVLALALPGPPLASQGLLFPGYHLVEDPALPEDVEPLGQRGVELAALVLHRVHHHGALGASGQQQAGCPQAILQVPVILDVHVVLKSPAIYKRKARPQPHRLGTHFLQTKQPPLVTQSARQRSPRP